MEDELKRIVALQLHYAANTASVVVKQDTEYGEYELNFCI